MPLIVIAIILVIAAVGFFMFSQTGTVSESDTREVTEETTTLPEVTANEPETEPELTPSDEIEPDEPVVSTPEPDPAPAPAPAATNEFTNGSYSANATYLTPARKEHDIAVTLTVTDDVVTAASVSYDGDVAKTPSHKRFDDAYQAAVVGVALDELNLSRVGGASLTSTAFNDALVSVKAQAAS